MPPKAKFTKAEILSAAFELIRREGAEGLTARALGKELGSSSRPVFTVFNNMDEVLQGAVAIAKEVYTEYVERGLKSEIAFKGVGIEYIRFAGEEPKLFRLLFMSEHEEVPDRNRVLPIIEQNYDKILKSLEVYNLSREISEKVYLHMWIYTHGIAVLKATKMCAFTDGEISAMLTEVCLSIIKRAVTEGKL